MQRWEYCAVGPFTMYWDGLEARQASEFLFTSEGLAIQKEWKRSLSWTGKDTWLDQDQFAQMIARLGDEGWEMVGVSGEFFHFKRPKDEDSE